VSDDYELLDSGDGLKLERFGPVTLVRPCARALWHPRLPPAAWEGATATFDRHDGNRWHNRGALPESWNVAVEGLRFRLSSTDSGHLGIFPEQRLIWRRLHEALRPPTGGARRPEILNLFAYSGGATLAAARAGAAVCHLDVSKGMVQWARDNAALNGLQDAPVRWIVEDVGRFLEREISRGRRYQGIILDPPSFGRGRRGEVFKVEQDLLPTLERCARLLGGEPLFVALSAHSPECTPAVLGALLETVLPAGHISWGELVLEGREDVTPLPVSAYAWWQATARSP